MQFVLAFIFSFFVASVPALADIYKSVDANGRIHFTDKPTSSKFKLFMKTDRPKKVTGSFERLISHYSDQFDLDKHLIRAVIKVESDFNPRAVSTKGAQGLMQLMPQTAIELGVNDPFDPNESISGGGRYLQQQLKRFGRLDLALAAYNAGPSAVTKYGGIPPYEETQNYVKKVKHYLNLYRKAED